MAKLVECVPNFSEGRRPEVIDEICKAITSADGVTLLDKEMDGDHNRAVVTFVCHPSLAVDAAYRGYEKAAELIDMTTHKGEHPRMGACDVCPFIPISEMTVEDAIELANQLGKRVGEKLQIPVFLYEDARTSPKRKNLAKVRQGEYEGMTKSIEEDPARKPDYGPAKMNLKSGATAIGVRFPLVAFNVYLNTNEKWIADNIADAVRSLKGGFRFVKALGFEIKERNQVQISMNLVNYTKTPIYRVFEAIRREASRYGVNVTSSEVIGLVPNQALIDCAEWFLQVEKFSKDQILEEKLASAGGAAGGGQGESFADEVASSSPAPGGGSVAAAAGALAAALSSMVCRLSVTKKKYAAVKDELSDIRDKGDTLRADLTALVDEDKDAFNAVMEAFKVSGDGRDEAVEKANKHAAEVPLTVMKKSLEAMTMALVVAQKGNENSISDAGVAGLMGQAAIEGAGYNVRINLGGIEDKAFTARLTDEVAEIRKKGERLAADIKATVEAKL